MVIGLQKKVYQQDDSRNAIGLSNLAACLHRIEDLQRAESLVLEALRISKKALGPNHPDVAVRLANLALIKAKQGDRRAALAHYREALRIDERAYGENHPALGVDLDNLAGICADLDMLTEAQGLLKRAVTIKSDSLGSTSRRLLDSLMPLLYVSLRLDDRATARAALDQSSEVARSNSMSSTLKEFEELRAQLGL
jgi:tetratricopeptide (TPR) repeat protein